MFPVFIMSLLLKNESNTTINIYVYRVGPDFGVSS